MYDQVLEYVIEELDLDEAEVHNGDTLFFKVRVGNSMEKARLTLYKEHGFWGMRLTSQIHDVQRDITAVKIMLPYRLAVELADILGLEPPIQFLEHGDANFFTITQGRDWVCQVQMNGKYLHEEQTNMLDAMIGGLKDELE